MERRTIPGRLSWQLGEVVATQEETARAKSITLAVPHWNGHRPGQHVDVRLTAEDGYRAERSYSIASAPQQEQRVTLTVERFDEGEVSPYLTGELRVGDQLELRGPIGGYFVWEAQMGGPLLLVAGGSGIVPLMAMIRYHAAVGSTIPIRLLYSSRSYTEVIYREELARLVKSNTKIEVAQTLTRVQPPGWTGYHRRIDTEMLREVAWLVDQRALMFICGPTPFVETAATSLVTLGYEPGRIKTERFGPTGEI
ncbi:oxidoreductase [Ktedonobacter sp. SOSP1-85]|uniref:ferredoxin reductase n=1 Tax=Ktedonobacter sp. SOSP1-85 TaxID=2778367 RepID=UPI001915AF69|nr:ferredoxin reductase [Ktedonobacter sp. SOSP1-85]GHO81007.1 oxidoreductase [Ktedonobacter sp. SOSP1-85]